MLFRSDGSEGSNGSKDTDKSNDYSENSTTLDKTFDYNKDIDAVEEPMYVLDNATIPAMIVVGVTNQSESTSTSIASSMLGLMGSSLHDQKATDRAVLSENSTMVLTHHATQGHVNSTASTTSTVTATSAAQNTTTTPLAATNDESTFWEKGLGSHIYLGIAGIALVEIGRAHV